MVDKRTEVEKLLDKFNVKAPTSESIIMIKDGEKVELSEDKLKKYIGEIIDWMNAESIKRKDFGMSSKVLTHLLEIKKSFFPATQKNINITGDFNSYMKSWMESRQKLLEMQKKGEITFTTTQKSEIEEEEIANGC